MLERDEYDAIQASALTAWKDSLSYYDGGHTDFAIHSFEKLRTKYAEVLHPHHHVLFNSYAKLMNCYMRTNEYAKVKFYCELIVNAMDAGPLPTNVSIASF